MCIRDSSRTAQNIFHINLPIQSKLHYHMAPYNYKFPSYSLMKHKNSHIFSYNILPSLRIDSKSSSCTFPSKSTISNSNKVCVSSSTSNANLQKSPPLTARSISLVLLKSPRALDPKRITFLILYFSASEMCIRDRYWKMYNHHFQTVDSLHMPYHKQH